MSSLVSNTISGSINFAGLGSGTDFTALVSSLRQIEEIPITRMKVWKSEWEYRSAAMTEVLNSMVNAKTELQSYNSVSKMLGVSVDSSDSSVATATINPNSDLTSGVYSIDVEQVATASLFSSKTTFSAKDTIINTGSETKEFSYTYKGTTRTIDIPKGTSLEQLALLINNDPGNPGVKASLLKNGNEYMFQVQGNDTGEDAGLHVQSNLDGFGSIGNLFTASDVKINTTGSDQSFTISHNGGSMSMNIGVDMTAEEFIEEFNTSPDNIGLTAYLKREGSDYVVAYKEKSTGYDVNPSTSSEIPALSSNGGFSSADAVINSSGKQQSFTYSYNREEFTVDVKDGATLQDLADAINNDPKKPDDSLTAKVVEVSSGVFELQMVKDDVVLNSTGETQELVFKGDDGKEYAFDIPAGTTLKEYVHLFNEVANQTKNGMTASLVENDDGTQEIKYTKNGEDITDSMTFTSDFDDTAKNLLAGGSATLSEVTHTGGTSSTLDTFKTATLSGKDTILTNTEGSYSMEYDGTTYSTTVPAGATLEEFVAAFNSNNTDVQAQVVAGPSGYTIGFFTSEGEEIKPENVTTDVPFLESGGDNWYTKQGQDAIFTLNGWDDMKITSASNTLTEVVDGMTITIKSEGETQLSVAPDTSQLLENVLNVVDQINAVKGVLLQLQKVNPDNQTASPEDGTLSSQFTWQAGSALTGNYGAQMVTSGFNSIITNPAIGFVPMSSVDDTLNDLYTTLSQIGIKTVTDEGDTMGLLDVDLDKLEEAISKDPEAVASLFGAQLSATTTSTDFTIASTGTIATAGNYDVKYNVDDDGNITDVYINGAKAETDPAFPGRYTVADFSNPAAGVALQFSTSVLQPGEHSSSINLKQGKVSEMISFIERETRSTTVPGEPQGTLPTIISNYADIMESIQNKIDSEMVRLDKWEATQKAKYARLDTLLATMNAEMASMANMLPTSSSG